MKQSELIDDLEARTRRLISAAGEWKTKPVGVLNYKPHEDAWSVLECLEHLNLYGDFYLPELEGSIRKAGRFEPDAGFKSGWIGERIVGDMLPRDGKVRKMKTFRSKDPANSNLPVAVIDRFVQQQERMLSILDDARGVDLRKISTRLTIPLIRFKLGTTLRFVIYHNERHIWQAKNVLKNAA